MTGSTIARLRFNLLRAATLLAEPFATLRLVDQPYAAKVEPLIWALGIVTGYHVTIGNILAKTVQRLTDSLVVCGSHGVSLLLMKRSSLLGCLRTLTTKSSEQFLILFIAHWHYLWIFHYWEVVICIFFWFWIYVLLIEPERPTSLFLDLFRL